MVKYASTLKFNKGKNVLTLKKRIKRQTAALPVDGQGVTSLPVTSNLMHYVTTRDFIGGY